MAETYRNPPTVTVVLVPVKDRGLLMVRRAIPPGVGELALPGGYQVEGETWQQSAAREVKEEMGVDISGLRLIDLVTVDGGRRNLAFAESDPIEIAPDHVFEVDGETAEVVIVTEPCETCFSTHTEQVSSFFSRFPALTSSHRLR